MTTVTTRPGPHCVIRDGRFITPCSGLADEDALSVIHHVDKRTMREIRSEVVFEASLSRVRCCPFCAVLFQPTTEVVQ